MDIRKLKRQVNNLRRKIPVGGYFIACNGHPSICTEKEFYTDDLYGNGVDGNSLINGKGCSCSLLHCGPSSITKAQAEELVAYHKSHSYIEYMMYIHPGTTQEWWETMDKEWEWSKEKDDTERENQSQQISESVAAA